MPFYRQQQCYLQMCGKLASVVRVVLALNLEFRFMSKVVKIDLFLIVSQRAMLFELTQNVVSFYQTKGDSNPMKLQEFINITNKKASNKSRL